MAKDDDWFSNSHSPLDSDLELPRRPGRQPKREATVDKQLQQLIKESSTWSRRAWDVWMALDSFIPMAKDAQEIPEIRELYDKAIAATNHVIKTAETLKKYLQEGKAAAVKKTKGKGGTKKKKGKS